MQKIDNYDEKIVDEFIEHFYNGEYKLKANADNIMFTDDRDNKSTSLRALLSEAMANYTASTSGLLRMCKVNGIARSDGFFEAAKNQSMWKNRCLTYITHARNLDLIIETECLTSKLKKTQQENNELKAENLLLKKKNRQLESEMKRFSKNFPDSQKEDKEYGDVE